MCRFPSLSPDGKRLCFTYQGNLWVAATAGGVATRLPANDGFAGLHDFSGRVPFRTLMRSFLAGSGPRPLVHVHPGRVDDELRACDVLTTPRETELAYLASAAFADDLADAGLHPARFADFRRHT